MNNTLLTDQLNEQKGQHGVIAGGENPTQTARSLAIDRFSIPLGGLSRSCKARQGGEEGNRKLGQIERSTSHRM